MSGALMGSGPFGGLFTAIALAYWGLALAIILFALWLPKVWWSKLALGAVVAAVVVYPIFVRPVTKHMNERQIAQAAYLQKLAAATAHFEERCKTAGETIRRSAQNVDGVVWMKWRFTDVNDSFDQFKLCQATSRTDPLTTSRSDPRLMISSLSFRVSHWPG